MTLDDMMLYIIQLYPGLASPVLDTKKILTTKKAFQKSLLENSLYMKTKSGYHFLLMQTMA